MAFGRNPILAADSSFSSTGATAWNTQIFGVTDATSGGIPYFSSSTSEACSALLASGGVVLGGGAGGAPATDTNLTFDASNKRLSVGSGSGTSSGLHVGYSLTSGFGAIWSTAVTPAANNYAILIGQNQMNINLSGAAAAFNIYSTNESVQKLGWTMTAGRGPTIIGGTATTDVPALEVTRTNNNAAVATGVKFAFTDTTSAAGFKAFQIFGGAAAATNLLSVSKAGLVDAPAYAVGGAAGASFGPGLPTSITVVNGIVTAIS